MMVDERGLWDDPFYRELARGCQAVPTSDDRNVSPHCPPASRPEGPFLQPIVRRSADPDPGRPSPGARNVDDESG